MLELIFAFFFNLSLFHLSFVVGDSCSDEVKSKPSSGKKEDKGDDIISTLLSSLDDDNP